MSTGKNAHGIKNVKEEKTSTQRR